VSASSLSYELTKAPPCAIDIGNMRECIIDIKRAALDSDSGPADPDEYVALRKRLIPCEDKLPPLYRDNVFTPYTETLDKIKEEGFNEILRNDHARESNAGLMLDIAQAILQNGEGYYEKPTDALQEVVSDLYDGFLSAEDRRGVKRPDYSVIAPLVKWGRPDFGPYTWPADAAVSFGLKTGVVNLPPANATHGLLAWSALAHETAGHDILSADEGLAAELATALYRALQDSGVPDVLPKYWSDRMDETASDIMGTLNMGPAVGIGLIGYFRGLNAAYSKDHKPVLRCAGPLSDPHPADILRGYLAASVVKRLSFSGAADWSKVLEAETDKDVTTIRVGWTVIERDDAKKSAEIVAETLMQSKMQALENHSLVDIQDWRDQDEQIVRDIRPVLSTVCQSPEAYVRGFYAAHVVAAAVMEGLSKDADLPVIFDRMQLILKIMHDANPSWGPLYVTHPGNMSSIKAYLPHEE
jgi:hypothetical protein